MLICTPFGCEFTGSVGHVWLIEWAWGAHRIHGLNDLLRVDELIHSRWSTLLGLAQSDRLNAMRHGRRTHETAETATHLWIVLSTRLASFQVVEGAVNQA